MAIADVGRACRLTIHRILGPSKTRIFGERRFQERTVRLEETPLLRPANHPCVAPSGTGTPVSEVVRKLGVSEATFYAWKKRFGSMGTAEIRELRQLREENARLKRVVADLTLDKTMLQDVISKKW